MIVNVNSPPTASDRFLCEAERVGVGVGGNLSMLRQYAVRRVGGGEGGGSGLMRLLKRGMLGGRKGGGYSLAGRCGLVFNDVMRAM